MQFSSTTLWLAGGLILARWAAELWLAQVNRRHVLANAGEVPVVFKEIVDPATYAKSVEYTLARGRFGQINDSYGTVWLLILLFSGVLPLALKYFTNWLSASAWALAAFLFAVGVGLTLTGLPFDWFEQFRLEEKFGFNTTTPKTWWLDRLKGLLLTVILGYPLLALILKIVEWTGAWWWFWAWAALLAFQFLMLVLAPVLILPLFNKFTPLPDGGLRERLLTLAKRTDFQASNIQVMDGSK